jgi:hypothetical protein
MTVHPKDMTKSGMSSVVRIRNLSIVSVHGITEAPSTFTPEFVTDSVHSQKINRLGGVVLQFLP